MELPSKVRQPRRTISQISQMGCCWAIDSPPGSVQNGIIRMLRICLHILEYKGTIFGWLIYGLNLLNNRKIIKYIKHVLLLLVFWNFWFFTVYKGSLFAGSSTFLLLEFFNVSAILFAIKFPWLNSRSFLEFNIMFAAIKRSIH